MLFFASLLVDGILAGAVYALIALAFVVVYKASRMINFALGEWVMFGSRLAATGLHGAGLGPAGALAFAGAAMVAFAVAFNRVVLRRLVGPATDRRHHGDAGAGRADARGGPASLRGAFPP